MGKSRRAALARNGPRRGVKPRPRRYVSPRNETRPDASKYKAVDPKEPAVCGLAEPSAVPIRRRIWPHAYALRVWRHTVGAASRTAPRVGQGSKVLPAAAGVRATPRRRPFQRSRTPPISRVYAKSSFASIFPPPSASRQPVGWSWFPAQERSPIARPASRRPLSVRYRRASVSPRHAPGEVAPAQDEISPGAGVS